MSNYQLPEGYKQTEVGVIPEDWDYLSVGNFITEFRGGAPLKPEVLNDRKSCKNFPNKL
jgi:hypothetical protein